MKVPFFRRTTAAAALAISAALALSGCSGSGATDESKTLTVWWFEAPDSAMGVSFAQARKDFEAAHPGVTVKFEQKSFDQIQQSGTMILNSNSAPDVLEYAKGSATAGLAAKSGLLTDLTDVAAKNGWDKKIPASVAAVGHYDERGVLGNGPLYGVPAYGEFVGVYYNKDMFAKYGVKVPTTLAEFESAMDTFVANGVTPLTMSGAEYGANHLWYELALSQADRSWVDNFQLYKGPVDFHDKPWTSAAQTMVDWGKKGYFSKDSTGIKATDMLNAFTSGTSPMMVSGSWFDGQLKTGVKSFQWGQFQFPGNKLTAGSGGNIWVVPEKSKNKDLAYDFINRTLDTSNQNLMGNSGGLPVAADPAAITDPQSSAAVATFKSITESDGLAYYPDWPAPGYYDQQVKALQNLLTGAISVKDFNDAIAKPYQDYLSQLK
ncbi:ABC transporter substrate-binding protein [Arthrobacter sp. MDT3-24]